MRHQDSNRLIYENDAIVSEYAQDSGLQTPEVVILLKYRQEIWGRRILDIGCGGGRTSLILTRVTEAYTGIDYSEAMIRSCERRFEKGSFLQVDVRDMHTLEGECFDFVLFAYNGLDYVPDHAGRLKGLHEIHRVLKRGGLFVFSSHNRSYELATSEPRLGLSPNPVTQLKNIYRYILRRRNRRRNSRKEFEAEEYAIMNDLAHDYSLLTYYIRRAEQIAQLRHTDFDVVEMYDTNGDLLHLDSADEHSGWIYYVARSV